MLKALKLAKFWNFQKFLSSENNKISKNVEKNFKNGHIWKTIKFSKCWNLENYEISKNSQICKIRKFSKFLNLENFSSFYIWQMIKFPKFSNLKNYGMSKIFKLGTL